MPQGRSGPHGDAPRGLRAGCPTPWVGVRWRARRAHSRDGRAVQDFAAVCRAALQANAAAARKLHLVAFDLLELAGDDVRSLPWVERTELLRETFPAGERLRLIQTQPARRAAHDQLVALGFEGSVLKRPGSTYRPGRQTAWRKYKASHRATATLRAVRPGRDGHTYAICDLGGSKLAYFRIAAAGSGRRLLTRCVLGWVSMAAVRVLRLSIPVEPVYALSRPSAD